MAQSMRPISNITDGGNSSSTPAGYGMVDGTSPDTGDWWYGTNNSTDTLEVLLTDLSSTTPDAGTCTVNIYQAQADSDAGTTAPTSGGSNATYDLYVYEGATQRASRTGISCTESTFTLDNNLTFTSGSITNWADVRVRFVSNGTGGTPSGRRAAAICYIEVSTPDEATDTEISATTDAFALTENKANIGLDIQGTVDAFTLTENQASVALDVSISGTTDAFTLTENQATITFDVGISAGVDSFTLTEHSAGIDEGIPRVYSRRLIGFV